MGTNILFVILLAISALISSSAFFFFPEVNEAGLGYIIAIAFAASIVQLLAVWFFLTGLKTFKKGLRKAYYWLSTGIFIFSLVLLIPSLSIFFPIILQTSVLLNNILFLAPFVLGTLFMYMGMRQFAKLLGVRYLWSSFWVALALAGIVAGIVALLPHPPTEETELMFDLTFASVAWCGAFGLAAMLVALHIRRVIGPVYKAAMMWMAVALGALVIAAFQELISKIYFLETDYVLNQYNLLWFLLVGVLFLRAGLAFKDTSRDTVHLPDNATYVDVVIGAAQMVSKFSEIDDALDEVRMITSHGRQSAQQLTPEDKGKLLGVYLQIEKYLTTSEPLHTFSQEGLRNGLPDNFLQDLRAHEQVKAPAEAA